MAKSLCGSLRSLHAKPRAGYRAARRKLLAVYQGRANHILIKSREGTSVSLPARHLRPFRTTTGVFGSFEIEFSPEGKLIRLRRLD